MQSTYSLEQIFGERLLRVPDYQRGYAWEEEHRQEFLQDLELLPGDRHHYTGTVVLHPADGPRVLDEEGRSYAVFDVVDGQQRLTSSVLLLEAVQREFARLGKQGFADGIRKAFVAVRDMDLQPLLRLRLNRDCAEYWEHHILAPHPAPGDGEIASHRRLRSGQQQFDQYLAARSQALAEGYPAWLLTLYQKLTQQLRFTLYQVESAAEVGVIFEVMNNRGKQLSNLEKVKNYLLYLSTKLEPPSAELARRVNETWTGVFERLMRANLTSPQHEDQLLQVHWLVGYDPDPKRWRGTDSIKEAFSLARYAGRHRELLEALMTYTNLLRDVAVAYTDAHAPTRTGAFREWGAEGDAVRALNEKLLRMRVIATFLPLLVATRLRYPQAAGSYLRMVDFCERYAFRVFRMNRRRADAGRGPLHRTAHALYDGSITIDAALSALYGVLLQYCPQEDFVVEQSVGDWYNWDGLKYMLYEYEEHLAGAHAVRISWHEIESRDLAKTVEHILPQSPTDPYWKARFDKAARATWTHDVGNLVLTQHNSSLSNRAFPAKCGSPSQGTPCYANSVLFQEKALTGYADWDVAAIEHRRQQITAWMLTRWAVPEGTTPVPAGESDANTDPGDEEG